MALNKTILFPSKSVRTKFLKANKIFHFYIKRIVMQIEASNKLSYLLSAGSAEIYGQNLRGNLWTIFAKKFIAARGKKEFFSLWLYLSK